MYFLKSHLRLPPSLEVPRTGLEYLFMSKAFLRAYMSDRLREMDPLDRAVLIPNLIVGNDHGAAEFAFNPIHLEPHEKVWISTDVAANPDKGIPTDRYTPLTRMFKGVMKNIYATGTHHMSSLSLFIVNAYGDRLVLTTVKPNRLYEEYQKTKKEGE